MSSSTGDIYVDVKAESRQVRKYKVINSSMKYIDEGSSNPAVGQRWVVNGVDCDCKHILIVLSLDLSKC